MRDFVLITIDSLRADHVGWHGYSRETTPNLDRRANDSYYFTNAFAHACSTRPSFPAILTSSHALMFGGCEYISEDRTLISEVFNNNGYSTAAFHSNLYLSENFGYNRGWDSFFDSKQDPSPVGRIRNEIKQRLDDEGLVYNILQKIFDVTERNMGVELGSVYVRADEITDRAVAWAEETSGPRFLWVHYMDVHHPYVPPERYQRRFRETPIGAHRAVKLRRKMLERPEDVTEAEHQDLLTLYDAEIAFVDAEIHRLLDSLAESWGEEPVYAITADHGEEFADHGRYSHYATFYDELLHVPFILSAGSGSGEREQLVGLTDLAPTLCDLADLSVPDSWMGLSTQPALDNESPVREAILCDQHGGDDARRFAYRDHKWKLIQREDGEYLYDLSADPGETKDVSEQLPQQTDEARSAIEDHRNQIEKTGTEIQNVNMDAEVRQRLRDLGYAE